MDHCASILISGGDCDPNLNALARACDRAGVRVLDARHSSDGTRPSPRWTWEPGGGRALLDGMPVNAAGAFLRYDVFHDGTRKSCQRSAAWFETVAGWLASDTSVQMLNRGAYSAGGWKPASMVLAQRAGLRMAATLVTNERDRIESAAPDRWISKPVAGGDHCVSLEDASRSLEFRAGACASPAIMQERLVPPEIRIFIIDGSAFTFEMESDSLDYRVRQDVRVHWLREEPGEAVHLRAMMELAGMNFGAADFKTDAKTGELRFLELNTSPMFARFDLETDGALAGAMVGFLAASQK